MRTSKVLPGKKSMFQILDESIVELDEQCIVVVTSKIVALCENRVAPIESTDKEELIKKESDLYLPSTLSKYGYHFTITKNTLISVGGIDESNSGGNYYVLWPKDPQKSANEIRQYLIEKFKIRNLGVIISDSTCLPMRWGTFGLPISYSGFKPTKNYIGSPDLFGKPFSVSQSGIAIGVTAAAVVTMGEGTEQTPIAIVSELPFVEFQDRNPTDEELEKFYIPYFKDDLYEPFFSTVKWEKGGRSPKTS